MNSSPRNGTRFWGAIALVSAALLAGVLTFHWPKRNGLDLDIDGSARAQEVRRQASFDPTRPSIVDRVLSTVFSSYVDPQRIDSSRMLLGALNAMQQTVAPLVVDYDPATRRAEVRVEGTSRAFQLDGLRGPWAIAARVREVLGFVRTYLEEQDIQFRDAEYAAINGMLRTLDPHSNLLNPENYSEMQTSTRGEFGGLGIVIQIRDGQLTVVRPMPNTPAERAGVHRLDRIVRINEESTLNMPLEDAMRRLRGAPGTNVDVWLTREGTGGFSAPRRFTLTRAVIRVSAVESRMLGDQVGYVKISSFQGNTHTEMVNALRELERQGMRGLVLDLRDNPGGLLDQAVRVADTFLSSGIIVTTSSRDPRQREEHRAERDSGDVQYPMIVLVNGGSASASEIVAGALKNHNRALVVGERTFGKGSVQQLFPFEDDGSALKLTIAQYLTPGDVSIQGVGVVPDIGIDPMTVDRIDMDLEVDQAYLRESDLSAHLTSASIRSEERPELMLRYYLPSQAREQLRATSDDRDANTQEEEFLLRFGRELLSRGPRPERRALVSAAGATVDALRASELEKAVAELNRLGIDWSVGADQGASTTTVEVRTNRDNNRVTAGDEFTITVRVTNTGGAPLYQVRAQTNSDYPLFNHRELVFGRILPGETREWTSTLGICRTVNQRRECLLPKDVSTRSDGIKIEFVEAHSHPPASAEVRTEVNALPRPQFAHGLHFADDVRGNGDGVIQPGEIGSLYFRVRNAGAGRSFDTQANLQSRSGDGVLLQAGRFDMDDLQPNEERTVRFTFEVLADFEGSSVKFQARIVDADLREFSTEDYEIPVAPPGQVRARTGRVVVTDGTLLREAPSQDSHVVGSVANGGVRLTAQAELGDYIRVELPGNRPAWVPRAATLSSGNSSGRVTFASLTLPPRITLDADHPTATSGESVPLRFTVNGATALRDVYVYVGTRKVFYRRASAEQGQDSRQLRIETSVPLRPGMNAVIIVGRESETVMARQVLVIRRDGANGELLATPRGDEWEQLGLEGEGGEEE